MKKYTLAICISLLISISSFSNNMKDTTSSKNELSFSKGLNFKDFYLTTHIDYARRITQKSWLKFGTSHVDIIRLNWNSTSHNSCNGSIEFLFGYERRNTIKSKFELIYGVNFKVIPIWDRYSKTTQSSTEIITESELTYCAEAFIGIYYKITENFSIGSYYKPLLISTNYYYGITHSYLNNFSILNLRYKF